jgi:Fe-S-cluster-containing hydrogenase component 2/CRP-like cAMP-binding protein
MNQELVAGALIRDDDEGLFSRDFDGQLVRLDSPTASDYEKTVTLQIDGQSVTVPLASPLKDAQGNIVLDVEGRTTPRYTTIYDAAVKLYVKQPGDEAKIPIPTLCHLEHMKPVAVCRLCVVQIYGQKRGKRAAERKLLPACQHQVKNGMEVFTMNDPGKDGERVRGSVKVLSEMLAADHLKPAQPASLEKEFAPFNELGKVAERSCAVPERLKLDVFSSPAPKPPPSVGRHGLDTSSPVFQVDHSACILCERCVRACDDVQENHVIGRTGKGFTAGVSFDLNTSMGRSTCVQCGECMVSCPTSAIIFKPGARVKVNVEDRSKNFIPPSELLSDPLFAGVSSKFLLWQQGLVVRRKLKPGDVVCRQGEAGNTAFLIKSGKLEITVTAPADPPKSLLGKLLPHASKRVVARFERTPEAVIIGEMACMTGTPRTATVTAVTAGEVWEIRRNVLDRLMRVPSLKQLFESTYRDRVLSLTLRESELFNNLEAKTFDQVVDYLRPRISFVRVSPGQAMFEQGDVANALYFVRLGHVRVGLRLYEAEAKVLTRGPGAIIGEIGLLGLSTQDINKSVDEVNDAFRRALEQAGDDLGRAIPAGTRSATCSALGHLELARLSREDFLAMMRQFPELGRRLVEMSLSRLRGKKPGEDMLDDYVNQGLYEGQSILVLDLDKCTRCDECTRGCIEEHGHHTHGMGVSRLLREGMRFGQFRVATSCRSCTDAHCMVGCPVDSIHRGKHLQIVIEDHCIGCGLCAANCPYGSIFMMPNQDKLIEAQDPLRPDRVVKIGQLKAAACDLCDAYGDLDEPEPQCVASCPHDAAFRMTGPELLDRISQTH